jgi:hypothetical protein
MLLNSSSNLDRECGEHLSFGMKAANYFDYVPSLGSDGGCSYGSIVA